MVNFNNLNMLWKKQVAAAQMKRSAWDSAKWGWRGQTEYLNPVVGGRQPKKYNKKQLRKDDVSSWLIRHGLPSSEKQNVELVKTSRRCYKAQGRKSGCDCKWVYKHPNIGSQRCWLCTSERRF